MPEPRGLNPNPLFLNRQEDGSARVRMKFRPEEVSLYEEAAGPEGVLEWMHRTLQKGARRDVEARRRSRPKVHPE